MRVNRGQEWSLDSEQCSVYLCILTLSPSGGALDMALDIFLDNRAGRKDAPRFVNFGVI